MAKSKGKKKQGQATRPQRVPPSLQQSPPAKAPSSARPTSTPLQLVSATSWVWTKRIGALLGVTLPIVWLIIEPGVEPLVASIAGLGLAATTTKLNAQKHQYLDKIAALALGVFCVISLTFIIKARRQEPETPVVKSAQPVGDASAQVWYATGIKNGLKRDVSIGIWSDSKAAWLVDTLQPEEVKWHSDTAPIYMTIQGDLIVQKNPRFRLTHTYEGDEAYELESRSFNHEPSDEEVKSLKTNKVTEILGGPEPKFIDFLDGSKISFEVFGPTGIRLKSVTPATSDGEQIYPFQIQKSYK